MTICKNWELKNLTGASVRRSNIVGVKIAAEKNLRKMKLVTAL